jgi:hypothetical protein
MKKLLFLVSISILFFASCIPNPEENPDPVIPPSIVLLRKTVDTYTRPVADSIVTSNFTYNGFKIVSIIDDTDGPDTYVTYDGNLITKVETKFEDGTVDQTETYAYDDTNRLSTYVIIDHGMDWGDKETYVYNTDGTVSITHFIGDSTTQTQLNNTAVVTFVDGEISTITSDDGMVIEYTYDAKNNPFKNVTGYSKIIIAGGIGDGVAHNIVREDETFSGVTSTYNYLFTYNASGYPETSIQDEEEAETAGIPYTTNYFY